MALYPVRYHNSHRRHLSLLDQLKIGVCLEVVAIARENLY